MPPQVREDRLLRRGFATIELPLALLALVAAVGAIVALVAVSRHGGPTAGVWLGVGLIVPFVSTWIWLVALRGKVARSAKARDSLIASEDDDA